MIKFLKKKFVFSSRFVLFSFILISLTNNANYLLNYLAEAIAKIRNDEINPTVTETEQPATVEMVIF